MSDGQDRLDLGSKQQGGQVEEYKFEPIKGYPMLNWRGKRPFTSTQFYPAQLKEVHGVEIKGWRNKIFWGDNLQVMSHLLRQFRGSVDLVYIDPPFDSKADYKKKITIRGRDAHNEHSSFEDKQYTDIWTNDSYLQFMYERISICRELMSREGSIYLHCDSNKSHHLRCILDELFGPENFRSAIAWNRSTPKGNMSRAYGATFDTILFYSKSSEFIWNQGYIPHSEEYIRKYYSNVEQETGRRYQGTSLLSPATDRPNLTYEFYGHTRVWRYTRERMHELDRNGLILKPKDGGMPREKSYLDAMQGTPLPDLWTDINPVNSQAKERADYPTQKPVALLKRIIEVSSNTNSLVLDFFMGSGTSLVSALDTGRRFVGADINLGAIQTTQRRYRQWFEENGTKIGNGASCWGLESYTVNHYDFFRNELEAKELLIEALDIQPLISGGSFDGEKDGRMVKIMPVNRIATKADLGELIAGFDQKVFQRRQDENPRHAVEKILLVCMGHEPDIKAELELQAKPFKIDVEVVDILRDRSKLEFKRDSEAKLMIRDGELVIENFYPMNLLQKLSLQKEEAGEWRELVDCVMVDWNYDGAVLQPAVVDVPDRDGFVAGRYGVPADAGTIRVKITDLLSESWEGSIDA